MDYTSFQYFHPRKPQQKIPPTLLHIYERLEWNLQIKKNGTNNMIFISPEKEIHFRASAQDLVHSAWQPSRNSKKVLESLPSYWYVFNAELLHSKGTGTRDTNYIFDMYVCGSKKLDDVTQQDRATMLLELFADKIQDETGYYYILNDNTWIAKNLKIGFKSIWKDIQDNVEDEGVVLKDPNAPLNFPGNCMVKSRKYHKNSSW